MFKNKSQITCLILSLFICIGASAEQQNFEAIGDSMTGTAECTPYEKEAAKYRALKAARGEGAAEGFAFCKDLNEVIIAEGLVETPEGWFWGCRARARVRCVNTSE